MWTPEQPIQVNHRFLDLQAHHRATPTDPSVFLRIPSLADPAWQTRIRDRLTQTVRAHSPDRPLYYSLADEPGLADLAAAWDFDHDPRTLAGFRAWLQARYGTLAELNAVWSATYPSWDAIQPESTTATMARTDGNHAAWNDFKAYMDLQFASALRMGTDAIHAADPTALAAIEGGQIPGWGGWDYSHLATAVDVMEIYDAGENTAIARSLNPALITLATHTRNARGTAWQAVLRGAAGLILWDDADSLVTPTGAPGPWGREDAALFAELRNGLGALLLASPETPDPVAILYSPQSFRLQWLLDHRAQGDAWARRSSGAENKDNPVRQAMRRAANALTEVGVIPTWITHDQLAQGALLRHPMTHLILPHTLSLSDADLAAIAAFQAAGGILISDGPAGLYDGNARLRRTPALTAASTTFTLSPRISLPLSLSRTGTPTLTLRQNGAITILGIGSARSTPSSALDTHEARVPTPAYIHDLRANTPWQLTDRIPLNFHGEGPALIALSPTPLPEPRLTGPTTLHIGETAQFTLGLTGPTPARTTVLHIELRDPTGRLVPAYAGTVLLIGHDVAWPSPFRSTDPPGNWTITVHDALGGGTASAVVSLRAP